MVSAGAVMAVAALKRDADPAITVCILCPGSASFREVSAPGSSNALLCPCWVAGTVSLRQLVSVLTVLAARAPGTLCCGMSNAPTP